ncbi:hypothetical protein [Rhodosalinus sp. FB01]|uniref:hypothetical protein n=1 Tax=Rhodosalinus sp. FB01 TaxID=3239194 RepID=UPI003525BAC1
MTFFVPETVVAEVPATKTVFVRRAAERCVSPLRIKRLRALLLIEELTLRQ